MNNKSLNNKINFPYIIAVIDNNIRFYDVDWED